LWRKRLYAAVFCRMFLNIADAARHFGIHRRTVERSVLRHPEMKKGKKVDVGTLRQVIGLRQACEGRGFPLGKSRDRGLPLTGVPKKPRGISGRTFQQHLESIAQAISAMTDEDQQRLLRMNPPFCFPFRDENVSKVKAERIKKEAQKVVPPIPPSGNYCNPLRQGQDQSAPSARLVSDGRRASARKSCRQVSRRPCVQAMPRWS